MALEFRDPQTGQIKKSYIVGGIAGIVGVLFVISRSSSGGTTSGGQSSGLTDSLGDLNAGIIDLGNGGGGGVVGPPVTPPGGGGTTPPITPGGGGIIPIPPFRPPTGGSGFTIVPGPAGGAPNSILPIKVGGITPVTGSTIMPAVIGNRTGVSSGSFGTVSGTSYVPHFTPPVR